MAKARAPNCVAPGADRDDGVQVAVFHAVPDPAPALGSNRREFPGGRIHFRLPAGEIVAQAHQDVPGGGIECLRHLPPGQPDRLAVESDIEQHLAIAAFANGDLAARAGCPPFPVHSHVQPGSAIRPASTGRVPQRLAPRPNHSEKQHDPDGKDAAMT